MNRKEQEKGKIVHDGLVEEIERALLEASPEEVRALVDDMGMRDEFAGDIADLRAGLEGVKALGDGKSGPADSESALTVASDPLAPDARVRLAFALGSNKELQTELQLSPEGLTWMTDEDVVQLYERLSARKKVL